MQKCIFMLAKTQEKAYNNREERVITPKEIEE